MVDEIIKSKKENIEIGRKLLFPQLTDNNKELIMPKPPETEPIAAASLYESITIQDSTKPLQREKRILDQESSRPISLDQDRIRPAFKDKMQLNKQKLNNLIFQNQKIQEYKNGVNMNPPRLKQRYPLLEQHTLMQNYKMDLQKSQRLLAKPAAATSTLITLPYFYLSSSASPMPNPKPNYFPYSSSLNHADQLGYKSNNELYSIFISMFTAAIFLIFIMWRWIKIKSDLRQALREQSEIEREMRANGGSASSPGPNSSSQPRLDLEAFRLV